MIQDEKLLIPKTMQEIKLVYSGRGVSSNSRKITCSKDAYQLLKANWSEQIGVQEEFNMLLLNRANCAFAMSNLSKGGLHGTVVDIRLAFAIALKGRASAILLAHNHPSGNLKPSKCDVELTDKFKQAGELLEIKVLDHLILSPDSDYYSFADMGNI